MMSRHTIRISDELWNAASARAALDGRTVSDVVRGALAAYIGEADGHEVAYRATSVPVGGVSQVATGTVGDISELEALFPRRYWTIQVWCR